MLRSHGLQTVEKVENKNGFSRNFRISIGAKAHFVPAINPRPEGRGNTK